MDQDHKPPVLISSAGRRAALLAAFREAGAGTLHACDLNPVLSAACELADAAHAVPRCDAPGFVEAVEAIVPLANMFGYVNQLRSFTQGRAQYTMQFSHYEEVPQNVADEVKAKLA